MTDPVYLTNTYDRRFEATVTCALGDRVTLDRTLFYPQGGGQPADRGTITNGQREWRVNNVGKTDTIYHHLTPIGEDSGEEERKGIEGTEASGREESSGSMPESGATVRGEIGWERRYGHMCHHTAQHLLSALLLEEYDAATTGNQLYADRARIDVGYGRFEDEDLEAIETRMNDLVSEARPVESYELGRETAEAELDPERTRIELLPDSITEIRIVEIEGYDRTACAGTHVRNTEEISTVTVTGRESRGSGEERLRFTLES
jgi:misacylated tRNA(Ala) deacylase